MRTESRYGRRPRSAYVSSRGSSCAGEASRPASSSSAASFAWTSGCVASRALWHAVQHGLLEAPDTPRVHRMIAQAVALVRRVRSGKHMQAWMPGQQINRGMLQNPHSVKEQVCAVVSRPPTMRLATSACSLSPSSGLPATRAQEASALNISLRMPCDPCLQAPLMGYCTIPHVGGMQTSENECHFQGRRAQAPPVAGSRTRAMQAHMLSSSSAGSPRARISCTHPSQTAYRRVKCASRSLAAGSWGSAHSTAARSGSLKDLQRVGHSLCSCLMKTGALACLGAPRACAAEDAGIAVASTAPRELQSFPMSV